MKAQFQNEQEKADWIKTAKQRLSEFKRWKDSLRGPYVAKFFDLMDEISRKRDELIKVKLWTEDQASWVVVRDQVLGDRLNNEVFMRDFNRVAAHRKLLHTIREMASMRTLSPRDVLEIGKLDATTPKAVQVVKTISATTDPIQQGRQPLATQIELGFYRDITKVSMYDREVSEFCGKKDHS